MRSTRIRALAFAAAALLLAGGAGAQVSGGAANFARIVAIGDSYGAGVVNASVVATHQRVSFPALFAAQAGKTDFQQPLVSEPGISPELALLSLSPLVLAPKAAAPGVPINLGLPRPYDNLSVPGATICDLVEKTRSTSAGDATDLVLRQLGATQLQQALSLQPTFVVTHIGGNDFLGAVLSGVALEGVTLTPVERFRGCYRTMVQAIAASGAKLAVMTFPDPTIVSYARAISPFVANPATGQPVLVGGQPVGYLAQKTSGEVFQLGASDFVLLPAAALLAQGIGIPAALGGTGLPLPTSVVLDRDEAAAVRARARDLDAVVRAEANAVGAAIVEEGAWFERLFAEGIGYGGIEVDLAFLTGGAVSYDGFHPTEVGYALMANLYIDAVNAKFGSNLAPVDLYPFFFGPRAGGSAMVSAAEAARAVLTPEGEENLRSLLGTPSRGEIDALVEAIRSSAPAGPGEEPPAPAPPAAAPDPEPAGDEPPVAEPPAGGPPAGDPPPRTGEPRAPRGGG